MRTLNILVTIILSLGISSGFTSSVFAKDIKPLKAQNGNIQNQAKQLHTYYFEGDGKNLQNLIDSFKSLAEIADEKMSGDQRRVSQYSREERIQNRVNRYMDKHFSEVVDSQLKWLRDRGIRFSDFAIASFSNLDHLKFLSEFIANTNTKYLEVQEGQSVKMYINYIKTPAHIAEISKIVGADRAQLLGYTSAENNETPRFLVPFTVHLNGFAASFPGAANDSEIEFDGSVLSIKPKGYKEWSSYKIDTATTNPDQLKKFLDLNSNNQTSGVYAQFLQDIVSGLITEVRLTKLKSLEMSDEENVAIIIPQQGIQYSASLDELKDSLATASYVFFGDGKEAANALAYLHPIYRQNLIKEGLEAEKVETDTKKEMSEKERKEYLKDLEKKQKEIERQIKENCPPGSGG